MNCDRVQNENIIERYLTGTLDPELKEAWEEHYFTCPECAHRLETWQAVEGAIREAAPGIRAEMGREKRGSRRLWIGAAAVAAMVILGIVTALRTGTAPPPGPTRPTPVLTAQLEPPEYTEPVLRGVESRAATQFRTAMRAYRQRDWIGAIEGLRASLTLDPHGAAPRFFLGASYLLAGNAASGVPELEQVAAGTSPFVEEARFVLAHGYLALGRGKDAESLLRQIVEGQGEFAQKAAKLLRETDRAR